MFRLIVSDGVEESITENDYCELEAWYEAIVIWSEHYDEIRKSLEESCEELDEFCDDVDRMFEVRYAVEIFRKKLGLMTEDEMFPGWEECDDNKSELELINDTEEALERVGLKCTLFNN